MLSLTSSTRETVDQVDSDETAPWARLLCHFLALVGVLAVVAYDLMVFWKLVVGGTLPLLGWSVEPNWFLAIVWLLFGTTITATIGYWAILTVCMPIMLLGRRSALAPMSREAFMQDVVDEHYRNAAQAKPPKAVADTKDVNEESQSERNAAASASLRLRPPSRPPAR